MENDGEAGRMVAKKATMFDAISIIERDAKPQKRIKTTTHV